MLRYASGMTPDLQALIERAYANDPEEAAALQRLVEAFEPPTEHEKNRFIAWFAAMVAPEPATFLPPAQSQG